MSSPPNTVVALPSVSKVRSRPLGGGGGGGLVVEDRQHRRGNRAERGATARLGQRHVHGLVELGDEVGRDRDRHDPPSFLAVGEENRGVQCVVVAARRCGSIARRERRGDRALGAAAAGDRNRRDAPSNSSTVNEAASNCSTPAAGSGPGPGSQAAGSSRGGHPRNRLLLACRSASAP